MTKLLGRQQALQGVALYPGRETTQHYIEESRL